MRTILVTLAGSWIALAVTTICHGAQSITGQISEPANIVFIMADDMGYADPSCFGGKAVSTPNLDRLVGRLLDALEETGLPIPGTVEGTSFVPLLDEPNRPWKTAALSEYPKGGNHGTAMRTDRYRYVQWTDKQGQVVAVELYDQQRDPQENQSIAATADRTLLDTLAEQFRAGWKGARPEK